MLKAIFPTLGRFRLAVQIVMLFVTVYGSVIVGTYMADKISEQPAGAVLRLRPDERRLLRADPHPAHPPPPDRRSASCARSNSPSTWCCLC